MLIQPGNFAVYIEALCINRGRVIIGEHGINGGSRPDSTTLDLDTVLWNYGNSGGVSKSASGGLTFSSDSDVAFPANSWFLVFDVTDSKIIEYDTINGFLPERVRVTFADYSPPNIYDSYSVGHSQGGEPFAVKSLPRVPNVIKLEVYNQAGSETTVGYVVVVSSQF